jgi:uncharacterized protein
VLNVVIDTNVFISAVLKPRSNPGKILELIRHNELELILSPDILSEIKRVLEYPELRRMHGLSPDEIAAWLEDLEAFSKVVNPCMRLSVIETDPSDNMFLECAVEGRADFIISGDRHLKDLRVYKGIEILAPSAFLEKIDAAAQ